jgi:hypothetical protein
MSDKKSIGSQKQLTADEVLRRLLSSPPHPHANKQAAPNKKKKTAK